VGKKGEEKRLAHPLKAGAGISKKGEKRGGRRILICSFMLTPCAAWEEKKGKKREETSGPVA